LAAPRTRGLAEASRSRLLRLPCRADKRPHASHVPKRGRVPLDAQPTQAQPAGQDDVGQDEEAIRGMAPKAPRPPSLAVSAVRRQIPKVGAHGASGGRPRRHRTGRHVADSPIAGPRRKARTRRRRACAENPRSRVAAQHSDPTGFVALLWPGSKGCARRVYGRCREQVFSDTPLLRFVSQVPVRLPAGNRLVCLAVRCPEFPDRAGVASHGPFDGQLSCANSNSVALLQRRVLMTACSMQSVEEPLTCVFR